MAPAGDGKNAAEDAQKTRKVTTGALVTLGFLLPGPESGLTSILLPSL